jgi:hypothetical protein
MKLSKSSTRLASVCESALGSVSGVSHHTRRTAGRGYFFWIEIHERPGNVLSQCKRVEALGNGGLDDLLEGVVGMAAELP